MLANWETSNKLLRASDSGDIGGGNGKDWKDDHPDMPDHGDYMVASYDLS